MAVVTLKSISGITSITTPDGVDNQLTLHTNNTNEAVKLDNAGNLHFSNHVNTTGVSTSSNFKTGSSNLHSTGLNVGNTFVHSTGVNASSADIDDFIDVGNNIKLGNAGVITATSFVGDGSDLTNLPAGLGTALSSTQTNPLNKMYYTNQVLGIGATVTVDPPASAQAAYTQYADIKVDDDYDLIIAEGDDLIPDVLGLADFGNFGGGPSAGRIRVNSITNSAANGAPTVQDGLIVAGISTFTGIVDVAGSSSTIKLGSGANRRLMYRSGDNDIVLEGATNFFYQQKIADTSHRWYTNGADAKLMISATGALHLGTTTNSNSERFHIHTASSEKAIIKLTNSTTGTGTGDGFEFGMNANEQIEFVNKENTDMFFATNNLERMRIRDGGNIVFGGTSSTGINGQRVFAFKNLDTTSSSSSQTVEQHFNFNRTGGGMDHSAAKIIAGKEREWVGAAANQDGYLAFHTMLNETSAEKIRIDSTGRLLVGTTNTANGHISASKAAVHGHLAIFKDSGGDNAGVDSHQIKFVTQSGSIAEIQATSSGAGGPAGRGGYLSLFAKPNNNATLREMLRVHDTGITILRQDTTNEGGEVSFTRASDNTNYFWVDTYGSGSDPRFRLHGGTGGELASISANGEWFMAPQGTIMNVGYARYDPNQDSYSSISQDTRASSAVYLDYTPRRSDSKLIIMTRMHTRVIAANGCSYGIEQSTNSGGSYSDVDGMNQRNAMDFFYKGDGVNHHYTGFCLRQIDSYTGSRRFRPWGQGWSGGTWEISYGHGEHSVTIYEVAV